jgi:hypothetical protein
MFDPVQGPLVVLLIALGVLSLPIEARLWRRGLLSDRTIAISVVGRVPVLVFLYGLIQGSSWPFILGTTALVLVPALALYRTVFDVIREQAAARRL